MSNKKFNPIRQYNLKQISLPEMKKAIVEGLREGKKQRAEAWKKLARGVGDNVDELFEKAKEIFKAE